MPRTHFFKPLLVIGRLTEPTLPRVNNPMNPPELGVLLPAVGGFITEDDGTPLELVGRIGVVVNTPIAGGVPNKILLLPPTTPGLTPLAGLVGLVLYGTTGVLLIGVFGR